MQTDINSTKRCKQLAVLSREHYDGLLFVSKLRRGIDDCASIEVLKSQCKCYWKEHICSHFLQEENILLQYISPDHEMAIQLKSEHDNIRELIISIDHNPDTLTIGMLADFISRHIEFEENVLFRYLEETLTKEQLDDICQQLAH